MFSSVGWHLLLSTPSILQTPYLALIQRSKFNAALEPLWPRLFGDEWWVDIFSHADEIAHQHTAHDVMLAAAHHEHGNDHYHVASKIMGEVVRVVECRLCDQRQVRFALKLIKPGSLPCLTMCRAAPTPGLLQAALPSDGGAHYAGGHLPAVGWIWPPPPRSPLRLCTVRI